MHAAAKKSDRKRWGVGCLVLALMLGLVGIGAAGLILLEARRTSRPSPIHLTQFVPGHGTSREADTADPGRVILDLEGVDLSIQPGPPGSPIRVRGNLDPEGLELKPEYSAHEPGGWTYTLALRPSRLLGRIVLRGGSENSIEITLPADTPMGLEGRVGSGNSQMELGGLWIVTIDLEFATGEQRIAFSKPLPRPMESFAVEAPLGELTLVELGNASPREVRINKNVGEVCLDLAGAWQADTTIRIACGVGSCDLHQPGEREAVVRVAGRSDANSPASDLPVIEVVKTGVLGDNVEISQRLPKPGRNP